MTKKLVNNFNKLKVRKIRPDLYGGLNQDESLDKKPKYISASGEKVLHGKSNVRLVFGKDRPNSRESGYGGLGDIGSGSIDIVAEPVRSLFVEDGEGQYCDPSFEFDAARVFVCGKSDIDTYFDINADNIDSKGKSCALIFGDVSRIFARQDIRLVSGVYPTNAAGGKINKIGKIQLIGMNKGDKLQPGVLGNNIEDLLNELIDTVEKVVSVVDNFVMIQSEFNNVLAKHKHFSPFFGNPTTPSEEVVVGIVTTTGRVVGEIKSSVVSLKYGLANIKMQYLTVFGSKKIKSQYIELN